MKMLGSLDFRYGLSTEQNSPVLVLQLGPEIKAPGFFRAFSFSLQIEQQTDAPCSESVRPLARSDPLIAWPKL